MKITEKKTLLMQDREERISGVMSKVRERGQDLVCAQKDSKYGMIWKIWETGRKELFRICQ